ncbi:MAG: intein-containing RctB family protein [Gemmataceae bacterium]
MGKGAFHGPLEKVDDCCYRIPKSYKEGMLVDGMIFADENLIDQIRADQAPEQVANVAFLPGIQGYSLAMPDIHWGYGFCIGGVCATDPEEDGVISPGGVGYDINCLSGDTEVLHAHGYTRRIDEYLEWKSDRLACMNLVNSDQEDTPILRWFSQKPRAPVLRVTLSSGRQIKATADHPFWTPQGMVPLGELEPGDRVAVVPFEGVPYERPTNDVLVSEETFRAKWAELGKAEDGNALNQALAFLRDRDLLPLRYDSPALPYLCKILGFVFGDGNLHFSGGNRKGVVWFYGSAEDLELIRSDIERIGFTPSKVYSRERHHTIQTTNREYSFDRTEESFEVTGSSFGVMLSCLGAPIGKKTAQDFTAPKWLETAPIWQRRMFLAAFFGAELTTPTTIPQHGTVFAAPTVGLNKLPEYADSGAEFLSVLSEWLLDFGVETQAIAYEPPMKHQSTCRWRLLLSPKVGSLINLWSRVGFHYNRKRSSQAALATQYLKLKQCHLDERTRAVEHIRGMAAAGTRRGEIVAAVADSVNQRFVERVLYSEEIPTPRVSQEFPTFAAFAESVRIADTSNMVWDSISSLEILEDFDGLVYDFTVLHDDHNFVANGCVVSNCGVRLVRSNLYYRDVKNQLKKLVESLFRTVPTGAGKSGQFTFRGKDMKRLLGEGASYLLEHDYGAGRDIQFTEAGGYLAGADPDAVSDFAKKRGAEQCGTLGSGNHFLEVQIVDAIFDEQAAQVMGLEKDMVCVMIHSGSRGLGYQVCDDALKVLRKAPEKYGIHLPDRQLACAPINSPEGREYIAAMRAAANFAWCNRQLLMYQARNVFADVFGQTWEQLQMNLIYDVSHNIAKLEEHTINGKKRKVWVHRKGATRAFPPDHPEIPLAYKKVGQPVIIPGDMGTASWVLVGQPGSMEKTFGTTCHGAGRQMSRTAAVKDAAGRRIDKELEAQGVIARAQSRKGLAEEQPKAYKNVDEVVDVVHKADISKKVARMRPIGVIKG